MRVRFRFPLALVVGMAIALAACASLPVPLTARGELERGIALYDRGDYTRAATHLERAIRRDPQLGEAYLHLARTQLALGDWVGALGAVRDALTRLSPEQRSALAGSAVDAFVAFALGLIRQGKLEEATALLDEALRLAPDSSAARDALVDSLLSYGRELLSDRRLGDAIAQFRRAIELAPREVGAYLEMARALLSNRELARALEALRDALRLAPENPEAKDLMQRLLRT